MSRDPELVIAAQRLRYDVFVAEFGSDGPGVDHVARREADRFDPFADHLLLLDMTRDAQDQVVGVYRLMTSEMAQAAGGFYCADEFDLTPLYASGARLLELGRSCLHPEYRGGPGMLHMWSALSEYVDQHQIDVLFGVASFHGTDVEALAMPLAQLYHNHLVRPELRVQAKGPQATRMNMIEPQDVDRLAAVKALPSLLKGYLRLGGRVGEGAFVDHAFNTVDVCVILERDAVDAMRRSTLRRGVARG